MSEQIAIGVSVLVYMAIFFGMILMAWCFVQIANAFRDAKHYKRENELLRDKMAEIARERNELRETVKVLSGQVKSSQPLNFFVQDCTMEKLRRENRKLKAFCETYRKQLEDRHHD